jgi:hypothetical protein
MGVIRNCRLLMFLRLRLRPLGEVLVLSVAHVSPSGAAPPSVKSCYQRLLIFHRVWIRPLGEVLLPAVAHLLPGGDAAVGEVLLSAVSRVSPSWAAPSR